MSCEIHCLNCENGFVRLTEVAKLKVQGKSILPLPREPLFAHVGNKISGTRGVTFTTESALISRVAVLELQAN